MKNAVHFVVVVWNATKAEFQEIPSCMTIAACVSLRELTAAMQISNTHPYTCICVVDDCADECAHSCNGVRFASVISLCRMWRYNRRNQQH